MDTLSYPSGTDEEKFEILNRAGRLSAKSENQQDYLNAIQTHPIVFAVGPAGTGKTYLAVAMAVDALQKELVQRIILTRPAVEAGERLGYLPGDLAQKVDPYLRPLYDALHEMLGPEQVTRLLAKNRIELAPLAYMRGRTLNNAFIILDEGQNTTREQMKMFLTRIGFGSIAVVTGDITQIDLPRVVPSGLINAIEVLKSVEDVHVTYFEAKDAVRHPIVQKVIRAYEQYDDDHDI
jgi:phosphate starvation-inducible PhoH-like protein